MKWVCREYNDVLVNHLETKNSSTGEWEKESKFSRSEYCLAIY